MKYLKKFNEELRPDTYFNAADKAIGMGHKDRADKLRDFGNKRVKELKAIKDERLRMEKIREMEKYHENVRDYEKFGTFKLNIVNPETNKKITDDFYLDINFDGDSFEDTFEHEKQNGSANGTILFFIGIIPTSEDLIKKCEGLMPEGDFGNGMFWGMCCNIDFEIIKEQVVFKKFILDDYDDTLSGNISFVDRANANKFRTLLKNIFTNPDLNYPSGYTDVASLYEKLEQVILVSQSFSSDYGFELKSVADYINTQSPNIMYRTL